MIEYKKGCSNVGDDFGLEVQGASDFDDKPEQPVVKQPKPTAVPEEDDENLIPF
jgi:hypothetical protein